MSDADHMRHALALAERVLGQVAPNPAVGCVLVAPDGRVVGRGMTQPGGRPHAEVVALTLAGELAKGSAAYVTLEPCAHIGHTPPCAEALVRAGVARVVAAVEDPDPRVRGRGFATLCSAGIEVSVGLLQHEAAALNAGFFLRLQHDRPLVTLKIARGADGKTIPAAGAERWITGEQSRRFAHLLRARHDAILIGVGTALADDPMLDCRLPGLEDRSPVRIVLDSQLRLPDTARLVRTARQTPTMVFAARDGGDDLRAHGVEVLRVVHDIHGRVALNAVMGVLAGRGFTRLLVEGGATVMSAFLEAGLADRLEVFTAAHRLGEGGAGMIASLEEPALSARFTRTGRQHFGCDVLESYAAKA